MQHGSAKERQSEALMRFVVMLFAMTGLSAFFRTAAALPVGIHILSFRSAALRLLWLTQAVTSRRAIAPSDFPRYFQPPDMLPKQPHEFLTAQNVAGRVPALYRAWDDLEAQAGRLVRWRRMRDSAMGPLAVICDFIAGLRADLPTARFGRRDQIAPLIDETPFSWHPMAMAAAKAPTPHDTS